MNKRVFSISSSRSSTPSRAARVGLALAVLAIASCHKDSSSDDAAPTVPLLPGEVCDPTNTTPLSVVFDPPNVVLAPGVTRTVTLTVEPDACLPQSTTFTVDNAQVAAAPATASFDLRDPRITFSVTGGAIGTATITAHAVRAIDGSSVDQPLSVDVRDPSTPTCETGDLGSPVTLSANALSAAGANALATASVSVIPTAFQRTDEFLMPSVSATVSCGADLASQMPTPPHALSPAVTFASDNTTMQNPLRREINFSIPINPAAMPPAGRMRHLLVLYTNPLRAKTPRVIPVANPLIVQPGGPGTDYVFKFSSSWFGTYQAVMFDNAGTNHRTRHLTHRAVLGFSMGGGGAASFGSRHHDQFDAIVPLGGPSDWNWMLWYVEKYALGGFCKASDPGCTIPPTASQTLNEPFAHPMDYNHWYYEPGGGNGGTFSRADYLDIFEDLALMQGNPAGQNADPSLSYMAPGPKKTDPWIVGNSANQPPGADCSFTVDPIDGDPNEPLQQQLQAQCMAARCAQGAIWTAPKNFFNADYNPDGTLPVISFCDGGQNGVTPYVDTWIAPPTNGTATPMNLLMAVDKNGNGQRDQDEPVIAAGHEPWDDSGTDGLLDPKEPGYDAVNNPDPNQDDYDPQINPNGSENNHHYDVGEPYQDVGLDGVANTQFTNVAGDVGEGDGQFTQATGLINFYSNDAHNILHQWSTNLPGGVMDDASLLNFDIMSDGGVRDLFNFEVVANHLTGAIASRLGANGAPLRNVAYYNGFENLPGADPTQPNNYVGNVIRWSDVVDMPSIRYGTVDATAAQIAAGDGQHVGTGLQLLDRLTTGFYYVAQRWPDADRRITELATANPETTTQNELGVTCELTGTCEKIFTGPKTGRTGPIAITLPPGYGLAENKNVRYPVLYVLHGYGQDPRDLEAVAVVTNNYMNNAERSAATRMAKFIAIYVDGRCRMPTTASGAPEKPECIRGTFYLDSNRPDGPKMDQWFDEVVDYVDQNYRTMGPVDEDVTD